MSFTITQAADSDVEMMDISSQVPTPSNAILLAPSNIAGHSSPSRKRKAETDPSAPTKRPKTSFRNDPVRIADVILHYEFQLANYTAEELEEQDMDFLVPYLSNPSVRRRLGLAPIELTTRHSAIIENKQVLSPVTVVTDRASYTPDPVTFLESNTQYQNINRHEEKWKQHLWNEEFDQPVYMTLNKEYEAYFQKHWPSVAKFFTSNPEGDLTNPIARLTSRDNWLLNGFAQKPDLVWDRMAPALRMASKFLTTPQTLAASAPIAHVQ